MKSKEEYCKKIKEAIEEVSLGVHAASKLSDSDQIMADLKIDSLDYATILLTCETWSGVKVKEDGVIWSEVNTIEKLAELLVRSHAA